MAEDPVSRGREPARVPRNDLPQFVHPSPWSAEERAARAPAIQAPHPPLAALSHFQRLARSNRRCHLHPGKTRRNRGPRRARTWGRRFNWWHKKKSHRDVSGTTFAFYCPGQGAKQRHGCGSRRVEPANSQAANIPAAVLDLGSWTGNSQTQNLHGSHERESLFL